MPGVIEARPPSKWPSRELSSQTSDPDRLACIGSRSGRAALYVLPLHMMPHAMCAAPCEAKASCSIQNAGCSSQSYEAQQPMPRRSAVPTMNARHLKSLAPESGRTISQSYPARANHTLCVVEPRTVFPYCHSHALPSKALVAWPLWKHACDVSSQHWQLKSRRQGLHTCTIRL